MSATTSIKRRTFSERPAFTLLELLVSMALVAVLTITLVTSLKAAFFAKEASRKAVETDRSVDMVMEIIRNDIESALPPSRGTFQQAFEATQNPSGNGSDDLEFFTSSPASLHVLNGIALGNGDIKQIELTVTQQPGSNDHVLVRRMWNNLLDPNLTSAQQQTLPTAPSLTLGDEEVLCRHVVAMTLSYYDPVAKIWDSTWDSTASTTLNVLPAAVQVTLQVQSPEKNSDGSPRMVTYVCVFQFPCTGASNDATATTTTGSGSTGGTGG